MTFLYLGLLLETRRVKGLKIPFTNVNLKKYICATDNKRDVRRVLMTIQENKHTSQIKMDDERKRRSETTTSARCADKSA